MYIVGVGMVRPLQPWDILLIYCNNQLKKYVAPLLKLARGALFVPLLMSMSDAFSVPFHTLIKLCYTHTHTHTHTHTQALVPHTPQLRVSDSVGLGWGPWIYISNISSQVFLILTLLTQFGKHCFKEKKRKYRYGSRNEKTCSPGLQG